MWLRSLTALRSVQRNFSTTRPSMIIPFVIENEGRGERSYDIYSRLLKERIVCLMTPVDDHIASAIIAQLLFLQSDSSKKPIHFYINSPGGSVTAGLAIYDTMQIIGAPVHTWCVGQASSMGSLLLTAGAKGNRVALPNSRIMVHQPSGGAQGTCSDIIIRAEEITRLKKRTNEIYVHHTGQSYETINATLDRDRFMSAKEAVAFGLVDRIETTNYKGSIPSE